MTHAQETRTSRLPSFLHKILEHVSSLSSPTPTIPRKCLSVEYSNHTWSAEIFTSVCLHNSRVSVLWFSGQLADAALWKFAWFDAQRVWCWWRQCHVTCDWHRVIDDEVVRLLTWPRSRWWSCEVFTQMSKCRVDHFLQVQTVIIALTQHSVLTLAAAAVLVSGNVDYKNPSVLWPLIGRLCPIYVTKSAGQCIQLFCQIPMPGWYQHALERRLLLTADAPAAYVNTTSPIYVSCRCIGGQ